MEIDAPAPIHPRKVQCWCPDDWKSAPKRALLLMHDGQNLFREEDAYINIWGIVPTLQRLQRSGLIPSTAVAGIWNGETNRWREYMPLVKGRDQRAWWDQWNEGVPDSREYGDFVHDRVLPALARALDLPRTSCPVFTMGSSMGALISLDLLTRFPKAFAGAGCLSTDWIDAGAAPVDHFIEHALPPGRHRIYFDHGTEGRDARYGEHQVRVDAALRERGWRPGVDFVSHLFHGAGHNEDDWRQRLEVPLLFLLPRA